ARPAGQPKLHSRRVEQHPLVVGIEELHALVAITTAIQSGEFAVLHRGQQVERTARRFQAKTFDTEGEKPIRAGERPELRGGDNRKTRNSKSEERDFHGEPAQAPDWPSHESASIPLVWNTRA